MAANSKIEWTYATFNPWLGCTKVAPGCAHCYAESFAKRTGKVKWGPSGTRVKTSDDYWRQPLKWNRDAEKDAERRRVFCASLADVFEDWSGSIHDHNGNQLGISEEQTGWKMLIPGSGGDGFVPMATVETKRLGTMDDMRMDLFALIDKTPWLDWLLLTKRPENVRRMWPLTSDGTDSGESDELPRSNVWIGTSISEQETADRNLSHLLGCRDLCPVLFLSAEPLLGPIHLDQQGHQLDLDWVIVGGESGHGARPMHPDWARSLRDQCQAAGVPFFFKQWGEFLPACQIPMPPIPKKPSTMMESDGGSVHCYRVGKNAAGRMLDEREWSEFPAVDQYV